MNIRTSLIWTHLFTGFSQRLSLCQALVNIHCEYAPVELKSLKI